MQPTPARPIPRSRQRTASSRPDSPPSSGSQQETDCLPTSRSSPIHSGSLIPRLRQSLYRLLGRSRAEQLAGRGRAGEDRDGRVSPGTAALVQDSLQSGLPIIPFPRPSFPRPSMRRSFSEGRGLAGEQRTLESLVQRAQLELDTGYHSLSRQSSYVEMSFPSSQPSSIDQENYLAMDRRRSPYQGKIVIPTELELRATSRRYKKGNKHKDDYVLFDFESAAKQKSDWIQNSSPEY